MAVDLPEVHALALDHTRRFVAGVRPEQLDENSVDTEWTVRELLNHVVGGNLWVPELVGGKTIEEVGDRLDGDLVGNDLLAAYDASAGVAAAAFREPGAMEREVAVSYGPVPGSVYCGHRFIDVLIQRLGHRRVDRTGHEPRRAARRGVLGGGRTAARRPRRQRRLRRRRRDPARRRQPDPAARSARPARHRHLRRGDPRSGSPGI
jgi:hypothetical protein